MDMKVMQEEGATVAQMMTARNLLEQLAIELKIENLLLGKLVKGGETNADTEKLNQ